MLDCKECLRIIDSHLAGLASAEDMTAAKAHAAACPSCRRALDDSTRIADAVAEAFRTSISPGAARDAVLAAVAAVEREATPPRPARADRPRGLSWAAGIAALFLGLAGGVLLGRLADRPGARPARGPHVALTISTIDGTVLRRHAGAQTWIALATDSHLFLGDELHTLPESNLVLSFEDGSSIRLEESSRFSLVALNWRRELRVDAGTLSANLVSPHPPFEVRTPQGLIRALGTDFAVTVR
jgi:ferric-dicitrate binding protein FerR (iron transport regulator)